MFAGLILRKENPPSEEAKWRCRCFGPLLDLSFDKAPDQRRITPTGIAPRDEWDQRVSIHRWWRGDASELSTGREQVDVERDLVDHLRRFQDHARPVGPGFAASYGAFCVR